MELSTDKGYLDLLQNISDTDTQGRIRAVQAVNSHITQTYWQVGRQYRVTLCVPSL
jgi:predicted deacylase